MERNELVKITTQLTALEDDLKRFNEIKKQYDALKQRMYEAMVEADLNKLVAPNGTQFTLVRGTEPEYPAVVRFNEDQFKRDHPELWEEYQFMTHDYKPGRKGYVKITLPKGDTNADK